MRKLLVLTLVLLASVVFIHVVSAACNTYTECVEEENQIQKDLNSADSKLKSLASQLDLANYDYYAVLAEMDEVESDLNSVKKKLAAKKKELEEQIAVRDILVRYLYKSSRVSALEFVLGDDNLSETIKNLNYFRESIEGVESKIGVINGQVESYEKDEDRFEEIKDKLAQQKNSLSSELGRVNYLTSYYNNQRAALGYDLNAAMQRQALLAWQEKQAGNGKQSLGGDGAFTFYGYGTEHGVGMSQYGAKKLAGQGKSGEEIIKFYYPGVKIGTRSTNSRYIRTSCAGTLKFEDNYLAGIGEVPNNWSSGVKEAQIIAARSYAWGDTYASGNSPPRTVPCDATYQVYVGGTGKLAAVNATRGKVATTYGGSIARLFYHSTSGPHTDNIWDSPSFSASQSSYPYLGAVEFNDDNSPYNNWCGLAKVWDSSPPPASCSGSDVGKPLTDADLELVLNASLLKNQNCQTNSSGKCLTSWCNRTDVGHLQCVSTKSTPSQINTWLKQEGTKPLSGIKSISLVRKCDEYSKSCSSQRVLWVTATGSSRNINSGTITGKRFRYIYNILSPEGDALFSIWFYVE